MPDLDFSVQGAEVMPFAAAPTIQFSLHIHNQMAETVRSVMLKVQVQIAAAQRHYTEQEQPRLLELFGPATRWGTTLKSLPWTQTVVLVPTFQENIVVPVPVPVTYDFEVVSAKYFHALQEGDVPLEFLFSGTVFYSGPTGLQTTQISWEKEAVFGMPVCVWQETMAHYFPNSGWLRLRQDLFDRLNAYKVQQGLPTWEAVVGRLLEAREG